MCSIFTEFLNPLVGKWRNNGIKIIIYLDDGIIIIDTYLIIISVNISISYILYFLRNKPSKSITAGPGRFIV